MLTVGQTSEWITGLEMTKMESGSLLGVERNQRALKPARGGSEFQKLAVMVAVIASQ